MKRPNPALDARIRKLAERPPFPPSLCILRDYLLSFSISTGLGEDMEKTCLCCKNPFHPHPAVQHQRYCRDSECQKTRKRKWQKEKLARDNDYRLNQASAQRQWRGRNKDYWRQYRERNPAYTERNRIRQKERNQCRRSGLGIAKMDELTGKSLIPSGRYRLVPLGNSGIAKMDELIVELSVISGDCGFKGQRV